MRFSSTSAILICLALGAMTSVFAQEQTPRSYQLLCKGGNFSFAVLGEESGGTRLSYSFVKAPGKATADLEPGQCANDDDCPENHECPGLFVNTIIIRSNGRDNAKFRYRGDRNQQEQMERLRTAMWGGKDFRVYVYTDRDEKSWSHGQFRVTRFQTFQE